MFIFKTFQLLYFVAFFTLYSILWGGVSEIVLFLLSMIRDTLYPLVLTSLFYFYILYIWSAILHFSVSSSDNCFSMFLYPLLFVDVQFLFASLVTTTWDGMHAILSHVFFWVVFVSEEISLKGCTAFEYCSDVACCKSFDSIVIPFMYGRQTDRFFIVILDDFLPVCVCKLMFYLHSNQKR